MCSLPTCQNLGRAWITCSPRGSSQLDRGKNAIPGPNFNKAHQLAATDIGTFLLNPPKHKFPNDELPAPLVGGPGRRTARTAILPPRAECGTTSLQSAVACAKLTENGLPTTIDPSSSQTYVADLASGGTTLAKNTPDARINNVETLPAGPFQLTNGSACSVNTALCYNDYAASPVHRFYQMWQQLDCGLEHARWDNPSGCNEKLFSWVEVTVGAGANGVDQPSICTTEADVTPCFTTNYLLPSANYPNQVTTEEGSTALGFYNMQKGMLHISKAWRITTRSAITSTNPLTGEQAPTTSCSATGTPSGTATLTGDPQYRRTITLPCSPHPIWAARTRIRGR